MQQRTEKDVRVVMINTCAFFGRETHHLLRPWYILFSPLLMRDESFSTSFEILVSLVRKISRAIYQSARLLLCRKGMLHLAQHS